MRNYNAPSETCSSRKVAYSSEDKARNAAICMARSHSERLRPYWCPECGKWHLTSHYSRENHEIYKNGHKYNRLDTNRAWNSLRLSTDFPHKMVTTKTTLTIRTYEIEF